MATKKITAKKPSPKKKVVAKTNSAQKRVAIMKAEEKKAVESPFKISLALSYETFIGKGESIAEALDGIPSSVQFKSKGTMTIEAFGKKCERVMQPIEIKRLLSKPINKVFFEKRMLSIMK